jgi:4'-phosphopantetheinyl transferase
MHDGRVQIHLIRPDGISPEEVDRCLTADEKSRAARFHFPRDASHWSRCRAALRRILGEQTGLPPCEVPLIYSDFGKPLLPPPWDSVHFNLSHCDDLALVAVSRAGPVGVDLERLSRASDLLECELTFCHPEEIRSLPDDKAARAAGLLRIWTAKEALLKALGTGLYHPPELVRIEPGPGHATAGSDLPLAGIENQRIQPIEHPWLRHHLAAISAPQGGILEVLAFHDANFQNSCRESWNILKN